MKGRGSIKKQAKITKCFEAIEEHVRNAKRKAKAQRAYMQALTGKTAMQRWKDTYFQLDAIQRKAHAAEKEMLSHTSLRDLIK
jgi:ribosomal protein S12 methylthiotransferase accessory factor YcaO